MSEKPGTSPFDDRAGAISYLEGLAREGEGPWPIAEAALALAALDRPQVDLARYRRHLATLAEEVAAYGADTGDLGSCVQALGAVIAEKYRYAGDTLTYEDVQNANLMRVIDRRKGLPVALGILYLHAGRAQGWVMSGLAFPGHFLVRIESKSSRAILDPFHRGRARSAAELRGLLKSVTSGDLELTSAHYATLPDRDVLLRLQNNAKLRLLESGRAEQALAVVERMLLFAPDRPSLLREQGLIQAELGNLKAAIRSLERFIERGRDSASRVATAALVQRLKTRLQ